jgi:hypothetical protein
VILSDQDLAVIAKAVARARRDGKDAAGGPPAEEPRRPAPPPAVTRALPAATPPPPSGTVLADTIGLRAARRRFWPAVMRWRVASAVIVAAVLFCGGAVTVAVGRGMAAGSGAAGGGQFPGGGAIAAAAARAAAEGWVARQVAPAAIIACDPQMCAVLQGEGIPGGRLLVLGAGGAGPLGADVIVSTAAVRGEFGSRLASVYAPVALAAFGSGGARVAVRVVAAGGPAAYLRGLHADAAARRAAGGLLVRNPHVAVSVAGRRDLAAGRVDTRLLTALGALATPYHVHVTGFGTPAAGASAGVPLRSADLSLAPARRGQGAGLGSVRRFLLAQQAPFRPAGVITVRLAGGQAVLQVEFTAPSPLGLLGAPN